jgi:hypothetical protein
MKKKSKDYGMNYNAKIRKIRRDYIGKFNGIRFSDARYLK